MYILIFDDNKTYADKMRSELVKRLCRIGQSGLCVVITDIDVLLLMDLSLFQAIFLCIDIPGLNGMDIAFTVRKRCPSVLLILVSSDLSQAVGGYLVHAFRFLLKGNENDEFAAYVDEVIKVLLERQGFLKIKTKSGWSEIKIAEILYIEGSGNRKVYFHMTSSEIVQINGKLADHSENLREQGFLRIQRGYLVNMRHITEIKNYLVVLDNGETLKASVQNYSDVCRQYSSWKEKHSK